MSILDTFLLIFMSKIIYIQKDIARITILYKNEYPTDEFSYIDIFNHKL